MERSVSTGKKLPGCDAQGCKLMTSGWIYLARTGISSEVQRGMAILSHEGQEIGKVAALVVKGDDELVEEILLSRLPEMKGYWLVPVEWILSVCAGSVQLDLAHSKVAHLESWHAE